MKIQRIMAIAALAMVGLHAPASAAKKQPPALTKCDTSIGTIALVDGDTAGWTEWGLGSPRALLNSLAIESGCFTPHNAADGTPARFLVTAIAGSQEDVDKGMELAKGAATEALWRSGAATSVLSKVPVGGALLGAFGGLGGKKKTVAAGLRVVSPSNGLTVAAGSGSVKKSTLRFNSSGGWAQTAANASGYAGSKDGAMLTEAFILAFNQVVGQKELLESAPAIAAAPAPVSAGAVVAIDTVMRGGPSADANEVRSLRSGTELTPTGNREGLFIEVTDNFGTKGWVSVEDMQ